MKKLALGQWLAQYGERVGLGVALVIMLGLALWGLFSSGPNLRPEQIKEAVERTNNQLQRGEASPASIAKYLPVTTDSLSANLEGVFTAIPTNALEAEKRIGSQVATAGLVRRNPVVRAPLAPRIASVYVVHSQFRVECERDRAGKEICHAYVIKPKPGVRTAELKAVAQKPNDPRQREMQQRLQMLQRMWQGMGVMGPGAGFGPGGPVGPGPGFPGAGPLGPMAGAGGGEGSGPGAVGPLPGPGAPQFETQYEIVRVPVTESNKYDLAEYLNCREAVLLVAAFAYADQMQEIAEALLLDRSQVPTLFHGFEVEKRVFALGDRLRGVPDELIIWDRKTNQIRRVAYTENLPNKEELGWLPVHVEAVAMQIASAIEFERETDPYWLILLGHSKNLAIRLPKMLGSGYYPWKELALTYQEIKATIDKIKQNQKLYEKPPPVDERLKPNIQGVFEGSETPVRSGAPVGGGGGEASDAGMERLPGGGLGSGPAPGPISPRVGGAAGTGAAGPRTPAPDGGNQPGAPPAPVIYNEWPDHCIIRFLELFDRDADLRFSPFFSGGRPIAVQYRIRVLLTNPNFGRHKEVQRPEMADKKILEGPWSPPSELLPLSRETAIYAEERDPTLTRERPADVVPLQVHRWLGIILELVKRERLAVGDWVVGSVWVGRGEFVGMYAKLPLAVWAPHVPADPAAGGEGGGVAVAVARRFGRFVYVPDVETPAFATHSILVDFENRFTWNDFIRGKCTGVLTAPADTTPQEVLILTEDGRLIARNAQRDKADPERQKRQEAWQKRLEDAKKAQPSKPAGGGNLFGGS